MSNVYQNKEIRPVSEIIRTSDYMSHLVNGFSITTHGKCCHLVYNKWTTPDQIGGGGGVNQLSAVL